ncbi:hypothetical protein XENORESO_015425 [Xenotaenia resolanae]|uniref:Uncharacterized protein n=1 Tax=Xenotaenia resolanae TaxID=208358 RepID=A0ABV0VRL0_9TELE
MLKHGGDSIMMWGRFVFVLFLEGQGSWSELMGSWTEAIQIHTSFQIFICKKKENYTSFLKHFTIISYALPSRTAWYNVLLSIALASQPLKIQCGNRRQLKSVQQD